MTSRLVLKKLKNTITQNRKSKARVILRKKQNRPRWRRASRSSCKSDFGLVNKIHKRFFVICSLVKRSSRLTAKTLVFLNCSQFPVERLEKKNFPKIKNLTLCQKFFRTFPVQQSYPFLAFLHPFSYKKKKNIGHIAGRRRVIYIGIYICTISTAREFSQCVLIYFITPERQDETDLLDDDLGIGASWKNTKKFPVGE